MIKLTRENIFTIFFLLFTFPTSLPQEINYINIGIVHSELTKQLLYKNDNEFYPILDWELLLLNKKISYSVIEDQDLNNFGFNEIDVLILPSVEILSDQALENLKEFLSIGKSIFIFGKLGSFDPQLKTRRPEALEILTGLKTEELSVENEISEQFFFNSNFLTQDLNEESGYLILNKLNPLYAEEIPLKTNILGNYMLDGSKESNVNYSAGATAIENEKGKILWFGFQLSQVSLDEENKPFFDQIILNAINWLAGNPLIWVNDFPAFYGSATLFSVWVDNINAFFNKSMPIFKEENVPLNLFISMLEIKREFEEIYKLSSVGDLNLLFDGFDYLDYDSLQTQSVLKKTLQILKARSRQEYFGIQISNLSEDDIYTLNLKNYLDFLLSPGLKFSYLRSKEIFKLMQNMTFYYVNDHPSLIESSNETDPDYLNNYYNSIIKTGRIFSHILKENSIPDLNISLEEKLRLIINNAKMNNSYITTYTELLKWFIIKNNIEVNFHDIKDESIIRVSVINTGNIIAEQIGLNISIPSIYNTLKLIGFDFKLNYNSESGNYNLLIPFLHADQSLTFDIEYIK
jgi:hypothetical protein